MDNFSLAICLDSGEEIMLDFDSIAELIDWMAGPDIAVEAEGVSIEALTDDGRRVVVTIDRATASVTTRIYDMTRDLAA